MSAPAWYPDWRGMPAAVIASGSSLLSLDLSLLKGRCRTIVVNRSCELAPWADALYGADPQMWDRYPAARGFKGLRITQDGKAARAFGLALVGLSGEHRIVMEPLGTIGHGGHSGFQALNLAIQFGARRILLLGFDLQGGHWHVQHSAPLRNPKGASLDRWRRRLDGQADRLRELGVEVVNCSPQSALTAFPKLPLAAALDYFAEPAKAA